MHMICYVESEQAKSIKRQSAAEKRYMHTFSFLGSSRKRKGDTLKIMQDDKSAVRVALSTFIQLCSFGFYLMYSKYFYYILHSMSPACK